MASKLKKGEVRNLINLPENYGAKVTIGGRRVVYAPIVEVTVYKDKWGRYTVAEKGHKLTAAEKKLGLKRTRSKEAQFIKKQFEATGPKTQMRQLEANRINKGDRIFKPWEINATKGWIDTKRESFVGKSHPGRVGEMEQIMRSLDGTTAAINYGYNFREMWAGLSEEEKFRAMHELQKIDWDNFWLNMVDSDGEMRRPVDIDSQLAALESIVDIFKLVKG